MQRKQGEEEGELESSYYPWVCNSFNVCRYYLRGLSTLLMMLSFPSPCLQVFQWLCLPLVTFEVFPLHFIIYNQLSSLYNFCLLPIAMPSKLQEVTCWFVTLNFHHHKLIVTFLWQLIAQGSKEYLVVNPLFFVLEEMKKYQFNETSYFYHLNNFTFHNLIFPPIFLLIPFPHIPHKAHIDSQKIGPLS